MSRISPIKKGICLTAIVASLLGTGCSKPEEHDVTSGPLPTPAADAIMEEYQEVNIPEDTNQINTGVLAGQIVIPGMPYLVGAPTDQFTKTKDVWVNGELVKYLLWPETLTVIDNDELYKRLWQTKYERFNGFSNSFGHMVNEQVPTTETKININNFMWLTEKSVEDVKQHSRSNIANLQNEYALTPRQAQSLEKMIMEVDAKDMTAYGMAELGFVSSGATIVDSAQYNIGVFDLLLRAHGKELLTKFPAQNDDRLSYGHLQLTSYAVNEECTCRVLRAIGYQGIVCDMEELFEIKDPDQALHQQLVLGYANAIDKTARLLSGLTDNGLDHFDKMVADNQSLSQMLAGFHNLPSATFNILYGLNNGELTELATIAGWSGYDSLQNYMRKASQARELLDSINSQAPNIQTVQLEFMPCDAQGDELYGIARLVPDGQLIPAKPAMPKGPTQLPGGKCVMYSREEINNNTPRVFVEEHAVYVRRQNLDRLN